MIKKSVVINNGLTIEDIVCVARYNAKVRISNKTKERILQARKVVVDVVNENRPVYGINTGFGKFSDVAISKEDTAQLQMNLIMSHACGVGEPMNIETARALMLLRANALSMGYSGISYETFNVLIEMLNKA
jgi:Histidine ammonia-lyase